MIYTLGETVYDIIFKNNQPIAAKAGGAALNSSITLGRLGCELEFISEIGTDVVGNNIKEFLSENKVGQSYTFYHADGKTAISIAMLDEKQEASYTFYKIPPAKRLSVDLPPFTSSDILLFGSFFAISKEVRSEVLKVVGAAKKAGAFILYDPNFRKPHLDELAELKPVINENISLANLVRGSLDDFTLIYNSSDAEEIFKIITNINPEIDLVCSNGGEPLTFFSPKFSFDLSAPAVNVVSTIGAGDTLNAGIIFGLSIHQGSYSKYNLDQNAWKQILKKAMQYSASVCESYDNYISFDLAEKLK